MELKQMISFQKVAEQESFSKAAKELYFSQPTITSHIMDLETELNVRLFHRDKSGTVKLTPIGVNFLDYVNQILALQKEAMKTINNYKQGKLGSIKIAMTGPDCYWLLTLLDKLKIQYPNVDIDIYTTLCNQIINSVITRKRHFGLIRREDPFYHHPLLVSKEVEEDELILVFSPKHRLNRLNSITLAEVCKEPLIAYGKGTNMWEQLLKIFNYYGLTPKVCMETFDNQVVKLFLNTSWGIAFLPIICVKEEINNGTLKTIEIVDCPTIKRYSILIYRKDMPLTEVSRGFLELLNNCYQFKMNKN